MRTVRTHICQLHRETCSVRQVCNPTRETRRLATERLAPDSSKKSADWSTKCTWFSEAEEQCWSSQPHEERLAGFFIPTLPRITGAAASRPPAFPTPPSPSSQPAGKLSSSYSFSAGGPRRCSRPFSPTKQGSSANVTRWEAARCKVASLASEEAGGGRGPRGGRARAPARPPLTRADRN